MAEGIALAASIFALVQIAGAATKLSRTLLGTARKAGSAKEEIEKFAIDINAFASVIHSAHDSIREYCHKERNSTVLKYIGERDILRLLVEQATRVRKHIEAVRPSIRNLRGKTEIINHIKWLFKRGNVKDLHPEMECVKTNLMVVMQIINLEVAQQRQHERHSKETRREIKTLKSLIKMNSATISILQTHQQASTQDQYHTSSSQFPVEQSSLQQLAESMVERGEVPESDIDHSSDDNSSSITRSRSPAPRNRGGQPSNVLQRPLMSSGWTDHSFSGTSSAFSEEYEVVTVPRRIRVQSLHQDSINLRRPTDDLAVTLSSDRIDRIDYLGVHSGNGIVRLDTNRHVQAETGNIITPRNENHAVTVIIDHELEANVISENFAIEYGLEVQDVEDDVGVMVELEPGRQIRSTGQVVLVWTKDLLPRKPLKVRCWVVPYTGHLVYFGKSFISTREHYWNQLRNS